MVELSLLLPCEAALPRMEAMIQAAKRFLKIGEIDGEILVALPPGAGGAAEEEGGARLMRGDRNGRPILPAWRALARRHGVRLLPLPARSPDEAEAAPPGLLAAGAAGARGRYVIHAAGDGTLSPDWLDAVLAELRAGADLVTSGADRRGGEGEGGVRWRRRWSLAFLGGGAPEIRGALREAYLSLLEPGQAPESDRLLVHRAAAVGLRLVRLPLPARESDAPEAVEGALHFLIRQLNRIRPDHLLLVGRIACVASLALPLLLALELVPLSVALPKVLLWCLAGLGLFLGQQCLWLHAMLLHLRAEIAAAPRCLALWQISLRLRRLRRIGWHFLRGAALVFVFALGSLHGSGGPGLTGAPFLPLVGGALILLAAGVQSRLNARLHARLQRLCRREARPAVTGGTPRFTVLSAS